MNSASHSSAVLIGDRVPYGRLTRKMSWRAFVGRITGRPLSDRVCDACGGYTDPRWEPTEYHVCDWLCARNH